MSLNLARRPFVNSRPITRLAVLLWLVGGALALWNGREIWRLASSLGEGRRALGAAETRAAEAQSRIATLQAELRAIDLLAENEETAFLNREIERRTLSWTGLFQRLGEVLPRQVRLVQIVPSLASPAQRRKAQTAAAEEGWISLALTGYAESDEALLDFVDALFAHPAFDAPDLEREAVPPGEPLQFELRVSYLSRPVATTETAAAGPEARPAEARGEAGAAAGGALAARDGVPSEAAAGRGPGPAASSPVPPASSGTLGAARATRTGPAEPSPGSSPAVDTAEQEPPPPTPTPRWTARPGRNPEADAPAGLAGDWVAAPPGGAAAGSTARRGGAQPVPLGAQASATRRLR